jgi:hypothetical protein
MEAIFHAPIPDTLKLIVLKGKANNGKNGSIPTNVNDKIPATPAVIKAAKLLRLIFNGQFALLIVILIDIDPIKASIVIINGIAMNILFRKKLIINIINTEAAIRIPIITDNDNLRKPLDISLTYGLVL